MDQFTHMVSDAGANMIGKMQEGRIYLMKHGLRARAWTIEA